MKDRFEEFILSAVEKDSLPLLRKEALWKEINKKSTKKQQLLNSPLKYAAIFIGLITLASLTLYLSEFRFSLNDDNKITACYLTDENSQSNHEKIIEKQYLLENISESDREYLMVFFEELTVLEQAHQQYTIDLSKTGANNTICADLRENEQLQLRILSKLFKELKNKQHYDQAVKQKHS